MRSNSLIALIGHDVVNEAVRVIAHHLVLRPRLAEDTKLIGRQTTAAQANVDRPLPGLFILHVDCVSITVKTDPP